MNTRRVASLILLAALCLAGYANSGMPQATREAALSEEWLGRTSQTLAYYAGLRDRYEPGKPMWLTEVAAAACGGNPVWHLHRQLPLP
ncbi:MAG TPA: hypothetical protein VNR40_05910 [Steroidobacter sp.]|nr:hypothetical protein [Steroidobacter sp.]